MWLFLPFKRELIYFALQTATELRICNCCVARRQRELNPRSSRVMFTGEGVSALLNRRCFCFCQEVKEKSKSSGFFFFFAETSSSPNQTKVLALQPFPAHLMTPVLSEPSWNKTRWVQVWATRFISPAPEMDAARGVGAFWASLCVDLLFIKIKLSVRKHNLFGYGPSLGNHFVT